MTRTALEQRVHRVRAALDGSPAALLRRGVLGSLLVLAGGLVVSTLPGSSPVGHLEPLQTLREHVAGRMAGLTLVLFGLAMLAAAWLTLCRTLTHPQDGTESLLRVRLAAVLWSAPLLIAPPLFSRDGWSYAAQGALTHYDLSPYRFGPDLLDGPLREGVDPRWMETIAPYGPLPLIWGDLATGLTANPWHLVIAHRLLALVGLVLLAWALPRLARWSGLDPALAAAITLGSPFMLANGVGGLHNDLLMVGVMAVALVVAVERGWVWGAVLGGAAAAVKLPGGLVCVAIALVSLPVQASLAARVRRLCQVAGVCVAVLVGTGVVWGLGVGWLTALGVPGTVNTPLSMPTVLGGLADRVAQLLGMGLAEATMLHLVRTVAQVACLVIVAWVGLRRPTGSPVQAVRATALLVGVTLLLSPVVHIWYLLWLTPFLAVIRLPRAGVAALIVSGVLFGLIAPLDSSLHGAYQMIIWGVVLVTLLTAALLLTRPSRERVLRILSGRPADWIPVP